MPWFSLLFSLVFSSPSVFGILLGANFSTSLPFLSLSSSPLIPSLQNTEESADEQLNMVLPTGGKVTPVCGAVCV